MKKSALQSLGGGFEVSLGGGLHSLSYVSIVDEGWLMKRKRKMDDAISSDAYAHHHHHGWQ